MEDNPKARVSATASTRAAAMDETANAADITAVQTMLTLISTTSYQGEFFQAV
jgi:hypothetical protein